MKLTSLNEITLKRVTSGPVLGELDDGPQWPNMIIAHVEVTVTDDLTPDDAFAHDLKFMTRIPLTSAAESLASCETRALRHLAQELRVIADGLDASAPPA